jgi:predicted nucleotidyltransferase/uncharacterized protein (UPF0332 family)
MVEKIVSKFKENSKKKSELKNIPTLDLNTEREIAMDFATKLYQNFDKIIKSVILFGSSTRNTRVPGSDIDIIIVIDDASIKFDEKLIMWYREELGKIIQKNPYKKELHINTVKLTTWWDDLMKGDPVIVNIIRYGDSILDNGGFFNPLKILLQDGRIKTTPEAMYAVLNRVPGHIARSKASEMGSVEGCYWAMIESAQALLMAIKLSPPNPEQIALMLQENFVDKGLMKSYHISNFKDIYDIHKKMIHGELKDIDGKIIDSFQDKSEDFFKTCLKLINEIIK